MQFLLNNCSKISFLGGLQVQTRILENILTHLKNKITTFTTSKTNLHSRKHKTLYQTNPQKKKKTTTRKGRPKLFLEDAALCCPKSCCKLLIELGCVISYEKKLYQLY